MPGSTPATSQLDWLSSTTAMIVLFWSRATRDLLKSFGWGIAALHRLYAATKLPFPRRPPHSISRFLVRTTGEESQTSRTTLPPSDGNPVRGLDGFVARRRHRSPSTDRSGSPPGRDRPDSITQAARLIGS